MHGQKIKQIARFSSPYEEPMAAQPLTVRVPSDVDAYVRSLPNKTEWLRKAIKAQMEKDLHSSKEELGNFTLDEET